MDDSARFDIIVWGATGYTGRIVAEYLLGEHGMDGEISWALAGRSSERLAELRDEIGAPESTPLIVADIHDPASLRAMVRSGRAIISTVGPYQLYGSDLVAACAEQGVDYLDLTGEVNWMVAMVRAHEEAAKASGARIIFSAGFDCIPFELGVYAVQQQVIRECGKPAPRVNGRVRSLRGGMSGGSMATGEVLGAALARDPSLLRLMGDPFALTQGFEGPTQPAGTAYDDPDVGPVAPFFLSVINTKIVHWSNQLMGHPYGRDFQYEEMSFVTEDGPVGFRPIAVPPKPGEGPTREERDEGMFDLLFIAVGEDGRRVKLSVKGDSDPGYGCTAKMLVEAAIALRQSPDVPGGFWSPGAALRERLIERLEAHAGMKFEVEAE
jgi:short subunit dehydrogenase-like uncharacterized protein